MNKKLFSYSIRRGINIFILFALITINVMPIGTQPVFAQGNPTFSVRLAENQVHGYEWPLGAQVTMSIDGTPYGLETVVVADWDPNQTFVWFDAGSITLQAGQVIEMTDGTTTKTHTVTNLIVTGVDPAMDTVSGTADPGSQVDVGHIYCDENECYGFRREIADSSGNWTADFSTVGEDDDEQDIIDITPGMGSEARQCDNEGDCTQYGWQAPQKPWFLVRTDQDQVHTGDWPLGTNLTLTVDDPETPDNPDFTDYGTVTDDSSGYTAFNFELHDVFDIQPGFLVKVSDGTTELSLVVSSIAILGVDLEADTVWGTAEPGTELYMEIPAYDPEPGVIRHEIAAQDGTWLADFSQAGDESGEEDTYDIGPGDSGEAYQNDQDASTYVSFDIPNPNFTVRLIENQVHGYEWTLGAHVTLFIDGNEIGTQTAMEADWDPNQTFVWFDLGESLTLHAGQVIEMTDGNITKTHTVTHLDVTGIDPDADTVFGTADPGSHIDVGISCEDCPGRNETADAAGEWTADYSVPGDEDWENNTFDIQPGQWGEARECDEDGDCTQFEWYLPNPTMDAYPANDRVEGWEWPEGTTVNLAIDDPGTPQNPDYTDTITVESSDWNSNAETWIIGFEFQNLYDLKAGDTVTLSDGAITKQHNVTSLAITDVDLDSDIVEGIADPNREVEIWICQEEGCANRREMADQNGNWSANFAIPGDTNWESNTTDIRPGTRIDSGQQDDDGDWTMYRLDVPNPTIGVRANDDRVEGHEWPEGATVTVNIDDPATPTNPDQSDTATVGYAPWDPNQTYFELDFAEAIDIQPGFVITATDGASTKDHVVTNMAITDFDLDTDIVYGVATPNGKIDVWVCDDNDCFNNNEIPVDAAGNWNANFQGIYDIQPGTWIDSIERDEDDDGTMFGQSVPKPYIQARINQDLVEGYEWPDGATITIDIDDPGTPENPDYTDTAIVGDDPWNPNQTYFELNLWGAIDIQPGLVVTASDGQVTKQLTVLNLEFTNFDIDADIVSGKATPGGQIDTWTCDENLVCFHVDGVPVDEFGDWSANFQGIYDIQPGIWIGMIERDEDDDGTFLGQVVEGAEIAGTVYAVANAPGNEAAGVMIEVCMTDLSLCRTTITDESGQYLVEYLPLGTYNLRAIPPGLNLPGNLGPITITNYDTLFGQDIVVPEPPSPPPPDAIEPSHTGGGTVAVYWMDDLTLKTYGDPNGTATFELTVFEDGYTDNGPMTETPADSGTYVATIPPLYPHHGTTQIVYTITYPDAPPVQIPFFIYIDPSGVAKTVSGTPIVGATVTLFRADNPNGPFSEVPDGSVIMSPSNRTNPDTTDENGTFGWDVVAGFYKVRVEKGGCVSPLDPAQTFVETNVLTIPPPVTDLELVLQCQSLPTVSLFESDGVTGIPGALVQYYSGGWQEFGTTGVDGSVAKEIPLKNYKFRVTYANASVEKYQDLSVDPIVVFQTVNATVELRDSNGALMDTGEAAYYSGGWHPIGTTSGGQVSIELLPKNYKFRVTYANASVEKYQDLSVDPVVVFQTVKATVELLDSSGALMDSGEAVYYSGGWHTIGTTNGGQVSIELLPKNYKFRVTYANASVEKYQDLSVDPVVVFQTVNATVELRDSNGALMDSGEAAYYSGGWHTIGATSGGQVGIELLPKNYKFRITYANASTEFYQDIGADPVVVFQTGQVISESGSCTYYYSGGWHDFTSGIELLPKQYKFRFNDGTPDTYFTIGESITNNIH